ncbi:hypothetical protein BFP97_12620 [Roseivirga sp. 4D4]|uniref:hypothetical protein n=1 Tax=Roseivirga sp. 4D4 TaxID=1889784 RepID=UPI000852F73B|nr:hypothetical protein [Roseivirga sp. 4D4]OEK02309.1 hypothetical protein BFP97_12620 [Roseivirga sp. 4D4]
MKTKSAILLFLLVALNTNQVFAQGGPEYRSKKTKKVIQSMIEAHGGYQAWAEAPSLSFNHIMQGGSLKWVSDEVHQQGSRKSYITWHDGSKLGFDGKNVWSEDWKIQNPAGMMAGVAYYFLNLPWITQDDGVQLELRDDEQVEYIEKGKSFFTVRMTYKQASPYEYYELYIDKENYQLRGVKYTMVDKDLMKVFNLPADTKFMGPLLKVYKEYTSVDGLVLPVRYDTHALAQGGAVMGIHQVSNYSISEAFDQSKSQKPKNGIVFKSLNNR